MLLMIPGCTAKKEISVIEEYVEEPKIPDDYFYPTITLKDECKEGIIYDINSDFDIRNYCEAQCYRDKCSIYFELVDEPKTLYKMQGFHVMNIYVRDSLNNVEKISTNLFSEDISEEETDKKPSGHYEMVLVSAAYNETIPEYEETVMTKEPWTEVILVKEGYYEDIDYCKEYGFDTYFGYICSGCGYTCENISDMTNHIETDWDDDCGSYSGQNISYGDRYCLVKDTYQLYHEPVYEFTFHEAEYETIHHPSTVIHHKEEYKRVWVED